MNAKKSLNKNIWGIAIDLCDVQRVTPQDTATKTLDTNNFTAEASNPCSDNTPQDTTTKTIETPQDTATETLDANNFTASKEALNPCSDNILPNSIQPQLAYATGSSTPHINHPFSVVDLLASLSKAISKALAVGESNEERDSKLWQLQQKIELLQKERYHLMNHKLSRFTLVLALVRTNNHVVQWQQWTQATP